MFPGIAPSHKKPTGNRVSLGLAALPCTAEVSHLESICGGTCGYYCCLVLKLAWTWLGLFHHGEVGMASCCAFQLSYVTWWPNHTLSQPASVRGMLPVDTVPCIQAKKSPFAVARAKKKKQNKDKNRQIKHGQKDNCYIFCFCVYINNQQTN